MIWRYNPGNLQLRVFAGAIGQAGHVDAVGVAARFNQPIALAYETTTGILNVLDGNGIRVRQIAPEGTVKTIQKKFPG